jgi:hypothetical protein
MMHLELHLKVTAMVASVGRAMEKV